jgi:iron complex outermembrane receptor protein
MAIVTRARASILGATGVGLVLLSTTTVRAQISLPPVTVDAPKQRSQTPKRSKQATSAARSSRRLARERAATPIAAAAPAANPNSVVGNLPASYAGGQVATGGQLGLLGNRGVMNTPFNQTNYTSQTIQDQQARTVTDVLANNPSIRTVWSDNSYTSGLMIRGFPVSPWDYGFNGLYGVVPGLSFSADSIERVEVLNGPSALINGMPPFGSVGGTINIVPKRATDDPITQLTAFYASNTQFGTHLDVGRRYGDNHEWGVRFNGTYRNGDTPTDNQSLEMSNVALGLDYRGERARVSLDLGYQNQDTSAPLRPTYVRAGVTSIPQAPSANADYFQPWTYAHVQDWYGALRAEYDLSNDWTIYGAVGGRQNRTYALTGFAYIEDTNGKLTDSPYNFPIYHDDDSEEIGLRGRFSTGAVNHQVAFSYSRIDDWSGSQYPVLATITSNLYNPTFISEPAYTKLSAPLLGAIYLQTAGLADTLSILDDRVQLTIGGRQQQIESTSWSSTTGAQTAHYDSSAFTPAVGLVVKPLQNVSLYANYIEGLQQGVAVPTGAGYVNEGQLLAPYVSKQVETGVKVDWSRVITTLSLFQITQPSALGVAGGVYSADGQQRNRGIELNATGLVTDTVRVLGGITLLDARLTRTTGGLNDGNRAPGVPDVQLNIGAEWDTPFVRGLTLSGRAIYTSAQYYDNANTLQIPDWIRFDVGARYTFDLKGKPVVVRANIINVGNKGYWASATPSYGLSLGAPRTYMLSTTFNF